MAFLNDIAKLGNFYECQEGNRTFLTCNYQKYYFQPSCRLYWARVIAFWLPNYGFLTERWDYIPLFL